MGEIFLKVFNMSVSACFPAAAIVLGRVLFKKAPRFVFPILWAAAALRLILPFSFQSPMSLMPGTEAVSITRFDSRPFIESGFEAVDRPLNDMLARNYHEGVTAPLGTTQKVLDILAAIWLSAAAAMLLYMILKYIFLYAKMKTAVRIYRNIYQSEYARSPFVLGIFAPKIYIPFSLKGRNADLACAHELSHISRLDHIWKPLGFIIFPQLCFIAANVVYRGHWIAARTRSAAAAPANLFTSASANKMAVPAPLEVIIFPSSATGASTISAPSNSFSKPG